MAFGDILFSDRTTTKIYHHHDGAWNSGFDYPVGIGSITGIVVAANGDIVGVDSINRRILRYRGDAWANLQTVPSGALRPRGLALDTNGDYLLLDTETDKIYRSHDDAWDAGFDLPSGAGFPQGLAVAANRDILFVDTQTKKIYRYSYINSTWDSGFDIPSAEDFPQGLAIDINGDILLVGTGTDKVYRHDSRAWDAGFDLPSGATFPLGLTVDTRKTTEDLAISAVASIPSTVVVGVKEVRLQTRKIGISVVASIASTVTIGIEKIIPPGDQVTINVDASLPSTGTVGVRKIDVKTPKITIPIADSNPSTVIVRVSEVNVKKPKITIHILTPPNTLSISIGNVISEITFTPLTKLPQLQVMFDDDRFRWADHFDARAQSSIADTFVERLLSQSRIIDKLPDPFRAILADRVATISCSNTRNANEAWRNKTTQQIEALHSSEVSFNEIVLLNRLRKRRVSVTLRDHTNVKDLMSVKGFMARISRGANRGSFTITGIDRNKLKIKIPLVTIADAFPAAVEYNSAITNESVRIVFGQAVRMKLYRLTADHSTFGSIDLSVGGIGSLTLQSVYRDGMVVPTGQYKLTTLQGEGGISYGVVQFLDEDQMAETAATQQSASPSIQVDVLNVEYKQNHARAIRWAVQAAGFAVDAASFAAAEAKFTALSYVVGGAITKRRILEDVLRELLVRGSYLTQIETSTDSATVTRLGLVVDEASQHTQLKDLDILWTDHAKTVEEVADFSEKEFADIPKTFKIEGYFDAGAGGDVNGWRMSAVKTNSAAPEGRDIEVTNSFIYDPDTLRSECDYRAKRLFSDVAALKVAVIPRLSGSLKLARTVNTELFPLGVYSSLWMVTELEYNAGKYLAQLTPYDQAWYTYSSNNLAFTSNVNFSLVSDFSHTRPSRPLDFELNGGTAALLVVGEPGTYSAIAPLRANAPAINATNIDSLVFNAFRDGAAFPFLTKKVPVKLGEQNVSVAMVLQPNVTYDFTCHAYKEGNFFDSRQDYRESFRATINNVITPEPSVLSSGFRWRSKWRTLELYLVMDVVENDGIAWVSTEEHISSDDAPTVMNIGAGFWEIFTNKGVNGRGIVSAIRMINLIVVTYTDGTIDSIPINDGKPGLPGPGAAFRWNARIENTASGVRPTNALVTQVNGGWALSTLSAEVATGLPTEFVYRWSFLISTTEKIIWFNGVPSVPSTEYAEFFGQTVSDPGGNTGIGDIITIQNATNPQEQWADFEVKGVVAYGLGASKWWGLRIAFYGDSIAPDTPLDLTQMIIRFSRVLQPPDGEGFIGPPGGDDTVGTGGIHSIDVLPARVQITTSWKTLLTRTITLTNVGAISVRGEFLARVFGQGTVRVEGRVQLIQGANTYTGVVQGVVQSISQAFLQSTRDFILRAIPNLTQDLLASEFTARLQVRYVVVSGAVLQSDVTVGVWYPRVSSANMVVTGEAPATPVADERTFTEFIGYQLGTSSPAVPSSTVETPPQAWVSTRPSATTLRGVYELTGVRSYQNGVFLSAAWNVRRVTAPIGTIQPTGIVTTSNIVRYRTATSSPSTPSSRTEDPPSGWSRSRPSATSTRGVYRLTGTRTYIDGEFQSASWDVDRVIAPLGAITRSTVTGYQRASSTPSTPSSRTESLPSGWSSRRPQASSTEGVYSLVGVRTYQNDVFQSTSWRVRRLQGPVVITTQVKYLYIRGTSRPSAPVYANQPNWSSSTLKPTATENVYRIRQTATLYNGVIASARFTGLTLYARKTG